MNDLPDHITAARWQRLESIAAVALCTRSSQTKYFRTRRPDDLARAKEQEAYLDALLDQHFHAAPPPPPKQEELFT